MASVVGKFTNAGIRRCSARAISATGLSVGVVLVAATTHLAGQTPGCSEPHYRWSEKTDASLASVTPKRAFISTILKTWTPLALTGQALYTCAPRSGRELETYSVTGWVRYLEKHESDGDWHLERTRGSHGHCNLSARALWEIHPVYWVRPP